MRILGWKVPYNMKVGFERNWWFRPASKLSTVIAYVLIAISLLLHLF